MVEVEGLVGLESGVYMLARYLLLGLTEEERLARELKLVEKKMAMFVEQTKYLAVPEEQLELVESKLGKDLERPPLLEGDPHSH